MNYYGKKALVIQLRDRSELIAQSLRTRRDAMKRDEDTSRVAKQDVKEISESSEIDSGYVNHSKELDSEPSDIGYSDELEDGYEGNTPEEHLESGEEPEEELLEHVEEPEEEHVESWKEPEEEHIESDRVSEAEHLEPAGEPKEKHIEHGKIQEKENAEIQKNTSHDHNQKGSIKRTMDREIVIAIFTACGYLIPTSSDDWKENINKTAEFLRKLNQKQGNAVVTNAKRTAQTVIKAMEEIPQIDKEGIRSKANMPLRNSMKKGLNVYRDFERLSDNQKDVVLKSIILGLRGQTKAFEEAMQEKSSEQEK